MRSQGLSVRARILAVVILVAALGMAIAGGAANLAQREFARGHVDERLLASAAAVNGLMLGETFDDPANDTTPPDTAVPEFATTADALQYAISRIVPDTNESTVGILDGQPRWVPATRLDFHLESDPEFITRVVDEVTAQNSAVMGTATTTLGPLRYIATPVQVAGDEARGIFVTAYNLEVELREADTSLRIFAISAAATLIVAALIGWFIAGRLLAPIRELRETASRITAAELEERIPVRGTDDVSALTETINDMLGRLADGRQAQSRLLADVRHELMTPITIVRGHIELLDVNDAAEVGQTRELALEELDRMAGLVRDIELLTSADESTTLTLAPVDVTDVTRQVFARASAWTEHEWVLAESADVVITADADRLTQAWVQLADNARKYATANTRVKIGSTADGGTVSLWVQDEGPGIPAEFQSRVFERLGRVDSGRGVSGSGLGLAIVRAIADAHGGTAALESSPAGSRFSIVLPCPSASGDEPHDEVEGQ